jgi:hypothetical protein
VAQVFGTHSPRAASPSMMKTAFVVAGVIRVRVHCAQNVLSALRFVNSQTAAGVQIDGSA